MKGSLNHEHLPEILHSLHRHEQTGVLQVTRELTSKRIYFGTGSIVFARSNQYSERLGEVLVRKGRMTRSHLADASNKMRARGEKLGTVLVQMGLLSEGEVREEVTDQMRGMIRPLFSWSGGEYCFQPEADPIEENLAINLETIPTILDGTRDVRDLARIRTALGSLDRIVSFSRDPWVHSHHVNLTPKEGFVLSRVDGSSSMTDILSITPMEEEETLRCLYTLISSGFLEFGAKSRNLMPSKKSRKLFESTPSPASKPSAPRETAGDEATISPEEKWIRDDILAKHRVVSQGTYYDWLEVRRTAKDSEIRKAYLDLVRKYHPDRHRSPHLRPFQGMLQEILGKAAEAYERLHDPSARRHCDQFMRAEAPRGGAQAPRIEAAPAEPLPPSPNEELAARYYREAKKYVANREFHQAVKLLEEVVELDASKAEYHRLLAQSLMHNPKWRKNAEEHFRKAMRLDPFDSESMVGLGQLYETAGMKQRALTMFSLALELDPDNLVIKTKLRRGI